ncbi:hypothetical protein FY528_01255 [Hymenobacter lutimineralis]|uniref:DUF4136 domain-containing protein n=1 Tax=Hymenobacter lutimineralis TaxID=2606448 RepID=A0A5D6VG45_9BACT|nr:MULTISPECIES: hypothetical protein [Hymenobacter]QIX60193.1 hypothetical protein HER32_02915 [Hymenobacter sp. BT18]TYZ14385.1 hypothetical protein FY528_01255 [Hymenobacter lutimineralis]
MPIFPRPALLLLGIVGLISCQKEAAMAPAPEQVVPLRVGNTWMYQRYYFDDNGAVTDSTIFTRTVLRDTLINQSTWYILSNRDIVQNNQNGYVRYNPSDPAGIILYANARFGGSIGYGYEYPTYTLWVMTWRAPAPAPVATSRHRYNAIRYAIEWQYQYHNQSPPLVQKREEYVTPGLGMVHANYYARETGQLQQRLELLSFTQP